MSLTVSPPNCIVKAMNLARLASVMVIYGVA